MLADLTQGCGIDLEQHRDNHQPDRDRDRQVDLRDGRVTDDMEYAGHDLAERNAGDDAQRDP